MFNFDINDYENIDGLKRLWDGDEPFLVPVFFNKSVLVRYLFDPKYNIVFSSETYGTIFFQDEWDISFGINPNGKIIFWLGDLKELPENEQKYLVSENTNSDHNITSEFYDSQINCVFSEPTMEVGIIAQKIKLNSLIKDKFGFNLFKSNIENVDGLFEEFSKYKKIIFGGIDDFKCSISDWNEILAEDINLNNLKKVLRDNGIDFDNELGSVKIFELFIEKILEKEKDLIKPYFILYNLRTWASHSNTEDKYNKSMEFLGIEEDKYAEYEFIYKSLLNEVYEFHELLIKEI